MEDLEKSHSFSDDEVLQDQHAQSRNLMQQASQVPMTIGSLDLSKSDSKSGEVVMIERGETLPDIGSASKAEATSLSQQKSQLFMHRGPQRKISDHLAPVSNF